MIYLSKSLRRLSFLLITLVFTRAAAAQHSFSLDVPSNFKLDREFAARLRPTFVSESEEPNGVHIIGTTVLRRLTRQVSVADRPDSFSWEVRINKLPGEPNAFSSPDGTIYIDRSLAQILGAHPGLWAAALSHEIAHILRRDWARRYIYEKFLQNESVPVISLGDFANSGSWTDSTGMAHMTSQFLQEMEIDADTYGLMLMARAGYHPDFMFSLHHLLRATAVRFNSSPHAASVCK